MRKLSFILLFLLSFIFLLPQVYTLSPVIQCIQCPWEGDTGTHCCSGDNLCSGSIYYCGPSIQNCGSDVACEDAIKGDIAYKYPRRHGIPLCYGNDNTMWICDSNCKAVDSNICDLSCNMQMSVECNGKQAGKSWCEGDIKKSCNSNCQYSEVNCKNYGSSYYCSGGVCTSPPRGGCPTLFVYNGKDYVKERKSSIHSQPGIDTVDDIILTTKPIVVEGNYLLSLKETTLPEHSYIDSVRLFVTDSEGKKEAKLLSAKHSKYGNVTEILAKSDDKRTDTQVFDNIELKFKVPELKGEANFTFEIEGYNPAVNILDKGVSIIGQVITGNMIYKFDIADFTVIAVVVAIIAIVLIFGFFKFFARKK